MTHEMNTNLMLELVAGNVKSAMKESGASSADLWQVPVDEVREIPGYNVRVKNERYHQRVRALADSMKIDGYKKDHPLSGFVANENGKSVIYLYGGHRRFAAVKLANSEGAEIKVVPMVVSPKGTSHEDLTADLVTGNNGEPLTPFETAIVCKRLTNYNWEEPAIASRLGLSVQYVNDLLFLISGPKPIRDMVQDEKVSASHAIETIRKHGGKALEILESSLANAQAAGKNKVTRRFAPGAKFSKFVKKAAPDMRNALADVRTDPGFSSLAPATQEKLGKLLQALEEAEKADAIEASGNTPEETPN